MKDKLAELRILWLLLLSAYDDWKQNVRGRLDHNFCCSGHECGCMGSSVRELYEWKTKPLNGGTEHG